MLEHLDKLSGLPTIVRKNWIDEPDLPEDEYVYSPTYGISGALLYNWEESDKSFRKRLAISLIAEVKEEYGFNRNRSEESYDE